MVADLTQRFQSLSLFAKKNNMSKGELDVLNIAFAVECQLLVINQEVELLPELTKQYTQLEKQILQEDGVKIA
ncbi:hypothetical protein OR571_13400 [Psychrobacillus sp. NEAU-3TGS]|uniref:hypothetical protein n=1 Tax=Psychrobacillus sp. NEAU-3TGS TaxID=2995412 RepID=UPI0024971321|nr:hypothetical protein [Psychrobacillus sp. NEAU-3TGS]MDI2588084.1 hypothetical protein [Psychrobacillus sp. NEAU-3TGS]